MPSEFDLIRRHFAHLTRHSVLGVGDDCAIVAPRQGYELLVSTDMLVAGTHFFADTDAEALGWKTAAVNLSDIAAMGGEPRWIALALALPQADEDWVAAFANGFSTCCAHFNVDWIGGDTTRGPLNLCATVFGEVPTKQAICRNGARPGDDIWVSGQPGLAALGLWHLKNRIVLCEPALQRCLAALHRPQPRIALGKALRRSASAMLDISDGLAGDLRHILTASNVGAELDEAALPLTTLHAAGASRAQSLQCLLSGGDDYELLFTAPPELRTQITQLASAALPLTRIGRITPNLGLVMLDLNGQAQPLAARGFDHFSA
ncbi:MAG: thiamine-phosphate kinase [Betaproteobacteria bacterium]|nr:thiamine-phosphate kinase [Betaproteobacteria bacterium]